jgi:tRNA A-37 threonylcarbamoyl transferase component Bud32
MAVDSSPNLTDVLQQFELLTPAQLEELKRQPPVDPDELADSLVRRGCLSPFQVERIRQGRGGELVLGNYVLLDQLGEGGMGQVYKARHRRMGRVVALKVIARSQLADSESVRRFQREIEAAAQLEHPNVVRAYDADQAGDVHFFVMEYVEGIDFGKLVRQRGPLPIEEACTYIRQAALGLQHAHERGLVHRDIKPSNLLLSTREGVVKILDLGLARWERSGEAGAEPPTLTRDGAMMGTPDFIAPEQARDAHSADIRSDLYSLGCTFYYLLTAKVPFPGSSLTEKIYKQQFAAPVRLASVRPDVPSSVASVVYRLMAKEPSARYQTPAEVIADLPPLAEGSTLNTCSAQAVGTGTLVPNPFVSQGTPVQVVEVARRPPRQPRRTQTLALALGCLLLLAFGGLLIWKMVARPRGGTTGGGNENGIVTSVESPAQAADALRKLGAVVTTASDEPDAPVVTMDCSRLAIRDEELAHVAALPSLEKLYLYDTLVGDTGLASVRELSGLQLLGLGQTRVTDAGLSHLRGLRRLQVLWMSQTRVTDTGMAELAPLTGLRRLRLGDTRIGDVGLRHLRGLTRLVELELRDTAVGNAGLAHLADMKGLQSLDLTNTSVDDAGLAHLAGLLELRHLKLAGCKVGDAGLRHLSGLHQLRTLDLTDTNATKEGVRTLQDALPGVKIMR